MARQEEIIYRLEDYRPSDFLIPAVALEFDLSAQATRVRARLSVERREGVVPSQPLVLDGDGLNLVSLKIDGEAPATRDRDVGPDG